MDSNTAQALIRFGLGRRGGEPLPANPAWWLAQQVQTPDPADFSTLPTTAQGLTAMREQRQAQRAETLKAGDPRPVNLLLRAEITAFITNALDTAAPFRERLVWFWANHFTVSLRQGGTQAIAGAYVREAIRPHVTGRFSEMVLAVMHHPAMLMYLDNAGSVGPNSPAGLRQHRGLNENLARECMELHTVTPASGYTQADVTEFAKILTGWSVEFRDPAGFLFRPGAHEPGPKTVMGEGFPPGEEGGVLALRFLANHPATHRSLAAKLVRHFVADAPPDDAVRHIEGVLRDSGGDLGAASLALISLPQAWEPLAKLRTPLDYVVASLRALDLPPDKRPDVVGMPGALGQPLWGAPLPNGWGDTAADWAAPEALLRRVDWAFGLAGRAEMDNPADLAEQSLGPLLHPATLEAVHRAGSRRDGITLLLTSPEFMRR
jgi:uncharacterized protein (DUF1800 family)